MARPGTAPMKDALGKFFMKIHPDLLWASPEKRSTNEQSMKGLNEILAWEKSARAGSLQDPPRTTAVRFHSRHDPEKVIAADFVLPPSFNLQAHTVPEATKAVNTFLTALLRKAEVLQLEASEEIDQADGKLEQWRKLSERKVAAKDVSREADASGPHGWQQRRREQMILKPYEALGDFGAAFDAQDMEVPEGAHRESELPDPIRDEDTLRVPLQPLKKVLKQKPKAVLGHLAEDFNDMMKKFWRPEDVPDITELITSDLIHYDQKLSPVDCAKAVDTLRENLGSLRYDKWYFVPLYVTDRYGVETDLDGFVSIPYWFTPEDFLKFVDGHEASIRDIQDRSFSDARDLEAAVKRARDVVPLSDLVIRCSHGAVRSAVDRLAACAPLLQEHRCTDVVLEIIDEGFQYGARETGVLQLPSDFTEDGLKQFLEWLVAGDHLQMVKEAYQTTITKLGELDRLLRVCYEVIGARIIDVESEEADIDEKTMFIRELYSISGELSKYDWSDYSFILGPLELDWGEGVISLPPNFHGQNFARTVHMLHEEDQAQLGGGGGDTPDPESVALKAESARIKAELVQTGLVELDPAKQTDAQRALLQMVEDSESEEGLQRFIKESFPQYADKHEAEAATQMELLAQVRLTHDGYTQKKLRRYFANRHRPRVGPNHQNWDFL
ncbi:hypothetical protein DIPPA_17834 [Diplonema papillatum]|nr:hypothetical protein DIPPA_17834 [Diplonema papillatum]